MNDIGQTETIGAQNSTVLVNIDSGYAKTLSNCAGVLGASSSEHVEDVVLRVESPVLGQLTDGSAHSLICYFDETKSHFVYSSLLVSICFVDLLG